MADGGRHEADFPPAPVLIGGSIAGALDILFALTNAAVNGMVPRQLLQVVASGLLGQEAYAGGGLSRCSDWLATSQCHTCGRRSS